MDDEDEHSQEKERRWNEAQKRYLEYFKQMTVLNTASMGVLVALSGQSGPFLLMIPLAGIAISLLGFTFSLLASMIGMFLVVEAPYFRLEQQRKLARGAHGFSALAFVVGLLVAVTAAMYVRLGAEFWLWSGFLALYLGMLVLLVARFRSAIGPIVDGATLTIEAFVAAFAGLRYAIESLFVSLVSLGESLAAILLRFMQFFRRRR